MHWIIWGPIAIVANLVAYYHGKPALRMLVRLTIQQEPENPVIEIKRPYEPQIIIQNEVNESFASILPSQAWNSTRKVNFTVPIQDNMNFTVPIQDGPLVGPHLADYDPVNSLLPLIILVITLFLSGSLWLVILFDLHSPLHNTNSEIHLGVAVCPKRRFPGSYAAHSATTLRSV